MIVALTGSTGMIGISLINLLLNRGHKVIAFVRNKSKKINLLPIHENLKIITLDLTELSNFSEEINADYFVHLGWDGTIGSGRNDIFSQVKNIEYTLDAVKLANKMGVKKFVGVGSQAECGLTDENISIKSKCDPVTAYGVCKYSAGKLANIFCNELGMEFNWVRVLSVYGKNDSPLTLFSYINKCIETNEDIYLTRCEQIWDYIDCDNAALILYKIMLYGKNNVYYPLGSGNGQPLKKYVEGFLAGKNFKGKVCYGKKSYSENQVMYLVADMSYLKELEIKE